MGAYAIAHHRGPCKGSRSRGDATVVDKPLVAPLGQVLVLTVDVVDEPLH